LIRLKFMGLSGASIRQPFRAAQDRSPDTSVSGLLGKDGAAADPSLPTEAWVSGNLPTRVMQDSPRNLKRGPDPWKPRE
jgi:hypothetical protein